MSPKDPDLLYEPKMAEETVEFFDPVNREDEADFYEGYEFDHYVRQ